MYPVLITPESYVFSIWGVIYLLLIAFVIYQALPNYRENEYVKGVGILFAVTSLFNVLWLFVWHYLQIGLSMIMILALLITLIVINNKLKSLSGEQGLLDWLLIRLPFSIYLAWVAVANLANFNILLNDWGILGTEGIGATIFTIIMILLGAAVALYVFYRWRMVMFPLVFTWAFIGIGVRHTDEIGLLTLVAWAASAAMLFFLGWITAKSPDIPPMRD